MLIIIIAVEPSLMEFTPRNLCLLLGLLLRRLRTLISTKGFSFIIIPTASTRNRPDTLSPAMQLRIANPIKTIVVLVMENRSFDHMLGWMKKLNPEIDGVDGSESNPISVKDPKSKRLFFGNQSQFVDPDPGHSFQAIREQIFGSDEASADPAPMNGFAQQAYSMDNTTAMSRNVMNGFVPEMLAVYKTLVSEFAVETMCREIRGCSITKKKKKKKKKRVLYVISVVYNKNC